MSASLDLDAYRHRSAESAPDGTRLCACGAKNQVTEERLTHCRLCGGDLESPESQLARDLALFGPCVHCGVRARANIEGYCEVCDPPRTAAVPSEVPPPSAVVPEEVCSGCGYCEHEKHLHCPTCCELGFPF